MTNPSDRETIPPSARERVRVAKFERDIRELGEYSARLDHLPLPKGFVAQAKRQQQATR